jgi:hypothetical protein
MPHRALVTRWVRGRFRVAVVDFPNEDGYLDLEDDIDPQLIDLSAHPAVQLDNVILLKSKGDGEYELVGVG